MISLEVHAGSTYRGVVQAAGRQANTPLQSFLPTDTLVGAVWQGQASTPLFTFGTSWHQSVTDVLVLNGGSGYSIAPTVSFSGGTPTRAASAYAVVNGGVITSINVADGGDGYQDIPTVLITDSSGTGAAAVADIALGWQNGQVAIKIDSSQSANLDPMGSYRAQIVATRGSEETTIIEFLLKVIGSPGVGTQPILTYCTFQDLVDLAPWVTSVQDVDVDLEGFYSQRLKARLWLDDIIINRFQNNYTGLYGAHSQSAFDALGGANYIGADPIVKAALAANQLILSPAVVQICAHFAVGQIGLAQVVTGNQNLMRMGQYHLAKANRDVSGIVAEIDTNADGQGDMFAALSTVNTMFG